MAYGIGPSIGRVGSLKNHYGPIETGLNVIVSVYDVDLLCASAHHDSVQYDFQILQFASQRKQRSAAVAVDTRPLATIKVAPVKFDICQVALVQIAFRDGLLDVNEASQVVRGRNF
ncbi:hypothetical protein [Mesorhizobium australafricanum]|uniref:hypothetical protein n=1 Tax=Mesorhizobium australafricanum TaxID=3072311 RepID=UPI002A24022F|nr:hypothetical protein [Mesorhizobium sp. VK3E]